MSTRLAAIIADHDKGLEYALVQCIGVDFTCPETAHVEHSAQLTDGQITEVLATRGWSVGPTLCPNHQENRETTTMTQINRHELTEIEIAAGVTLDQVAQVLPKALLRDERVILPADTAPALAGSVARCVFGEPAEYAGHNQLGLPVYRRVTTPNHP